MATAKRKTSSATSTAKGATADNARMVEVGVLFSKAHEVLKAAQGRLNSNLTLARSLRGERREAAAKEDFKKVSSLQGKIDKLEREEPQKRAEVDSAIEKFTAASADAVAAYFAPEVLAQSVKIVRVTIIDPITLNHYSATYVEGEDSDIQLSLPGGIYFESEARHLDSWVLEQGLILDRKTVEITV